MEALEWVLDMKDAVGEQMQQIMQEIIQHIMPFFGDPNIHPSHGITKSESDIGTSIELILYKIYLDKKTGRFENHDKNLA